MARRSILALVSVLFLLAPVAPVAAQDAAQAAPPDSARNVLLTIKLGSIVGDDRQTVKEYQLVLAENTRGSRLLSGARVPLQTEVGDDDADVVTSYTYQNIGFTVTAEVRPAPNGRIALSALLEDSRIRDDADPTAGPPVVETRQLSVEVVLEDGKLLEITRVEGVDDDPGYVEVRADVLD